MPGISPSVMVHKLNANPSFKPVKQRWRGYLIEKSKVPVEEVKKLYKAGFIKEV